MLLYVPQNPLHRQIVHARASTTLDTTVHAAASLEVVETAYLRSSSACRTGMIGALCISSSCKPALQQQYEVWMSSGNET